MMPRQSMQSQVLNAFAIEPQVMIYISVFRKPARHFPIARLDIAQSRLIEAGHNRAERQGEKITLGAPPGTLVGNGVRQFADLMHSDHGANVSLLSLSVRPPVECNLAPIHCEIIRSEGLGTPKDPVRTGLNVEAELRLPAIRQSGLDYLSFN